MTKKNSRKKMLILLDNIDELYLKSDLETFLSFINKEFLDIDYKVLTKKTKLTNVKQKKVSYSYFNKNDIANCQYDIAITYSNSKSFYEISKLDNCKLKIVFVTNDIFGKKHGYYKKQFLIKNYRNFDKIICNTLDVADNFIKNTQLYQEVLYIPWQENKDETKKVVNEIINFKDKINKESDIFCTVFTPTYNRAYIIENLYRSLQKQKFKNFEWLVIDDGSQDNTEELFKKWQKEKNDFKINYIKIANGGKQRAVNFGVEKAKGKMFFIVDSDDYITDDAINEIYLCEKTISKYDDFAGISGLRGYNEKTAIGSFLNKDFIDCTNCERLKYNLDGDKSEVYYTDLLKRYKFPDIKGEKFVSEGVVWNKIGGDGYKIRWFNKIFIICNYIEDGYTVQGNRLFEKNPKGYLLMLNSLDRFFNINIRSKMVRYYDYYNFFKKEKSICEIADELQIHVLFLVTSIALKKAYNLLKLLKRKNI